MKTSLIRRTLPTVAAVVTLSATAASASDWKWSVTPYVWATNVGVDVAIDDRQVVDQTIPVEDLLEDLDTIAQVRVEAQHGGQGLFLDLFDVNLSDDAQSFAVPAGGSVELTPEMGMTIADLGGFYDPNGDQQGFQVFYGARILNERAEIDAGFSLANGAEVEKRYDVDDTMVDALVGIRYLRSFRRRWIVDLRADASTGGTELTWSASPSIGYTFGESGRTTATFGYRWMSVDFDTSDAATEVAAEMTLSGFVAGLRFAF